MTAKSLVIARQNTELNNYEFLAKLLLSACGCGESASCSIEGLVHII